MQTMQDDLFVAHYMKCGKTLFAREVKNEIFNNLESNLNHMIWRCCVWYHNIPFVFCVHSDCHVTHMRYFKVVVHTSDMVWCKNLITTQSQASLNTSCIVNLFNPIELWSIAMHCEYQWTIYIHFHGEWINTLNWINM